MIDFAWPWIALALPLPWLLRRFWSPAELSREAALRVPHMDQMIPATDARATRARSGLALALMSLAWVCLVAATCRPLWIDEAVEMPLSGRDLMLAVDLSGSMAVEDFELEGQWVDRSTATRAVASEFIGRRVGDRVGLILFGSNAYLQAPLSFDRDTVAQLLMESFIGLAGKETAIGDAIGLAIKRLRDRPVSNRVLILLTDGANTAGELDPATATGLARDTGVRIYTIGIGADQMTVRSLFGAQRVNPSRDLDERLLSHIADTTGGRYFRARDTAELEQIYAELDRLEPVDRNVYDARPTRELFVWPLAMATCFWVVGIYLAERR